MIEGLSAPFCQNRPFWGTQKSLEKQKRTSHEQWSKPLWHSMSHPGWLMTGSLFHGLLSSLYNWLVFHPLYNPKQPGWKWSLLTSLHQPLLRWQHHDNEEKSTCYLDDGEILQLIGGPLVGWGICQGWNFLPSFFLGDYFITHEIRIPIKQPGFKGKYYISLLNNQYSLYRGYNKPL